MLLLLFAPLVLYFPQIIPGVETQPVLPLLLAMRCFLQGRHERPKVAMLALMAGLLLWISLRIAAHDDASASVGLLQLLVGPFVLFALLAAEPVQPSARNMQLLAAGLAVLAAVEMLLPSVYLALTSSLLTRFNVADGHRGISLLTPEPTYAAISAVYFFLLGEWSAPQWAGRHLLTRACLGLSTVLTGSTYLGLFMLALFAAVSPRLFMATLLLMLAAVPVIGAAALDNEDSIRAVVAISRFLASDFSNLLPSLSVIDSSLGSRMTVNAASFLTPFNNPLGEGLNCAGVVHALDAAQFDFAYSNPVLSGVIADGCLKPQSYGASAALGLGLGVLPFGILLGCLAGFARPPQRRPLWITPMAVAAVMLVVQGQVTSPVPWLLIYLATSGRPGRPATAPIAHDPAPAIANLVP